MFKNLPPLCRYVILALVASAVVSLVLPSFVITVWPLYPVRVSHGELWRLISYPFFFIASARALIGSILNLVWTGMIVAFFGGELETIVHTARLLRGLIITVVGAAILFIFFDSQGVLAGPHILTMFLLGGFAYMWPKREISIFGLFWVKAWIIAVALFVLAIIPLNGMMLDTSASNLFAPLAGAVGAIVYFHIMYRQYAFGRALLTRFDRKRPSNIIKSTDTTVQQRIDIILDKISRSGIDSLSREEREFLLKNSN